MESSPHEIIARLHHERDSHTNEQILAELIALPALPDEEDEVWDSEQMWLQAYLYLALADLAAERKLMAAIVPLLERASYGDPGEIMRGLRHSLEAIAKPNWSELASICSDLSRHPHPGARLWSVNELGILREPETLNCLIAALQDDASLVRMEACNALTGLCQEHSYCKEAVLEGLRNYQERTGENLDEWKCAQEAILDIQKMA